MPRLNGVVALVLIAGLLGAACGGSSGGDAEPTAPAAVASASPSEASASNATNTPRPTPTFAPTFTPTATATPEPTPTLEPTPVPIAQDGTGNSNVDVALTAGLTVVTMRHYGQDRFEVRLLTEDGEGRGQLAADRGSFQGSRAIAVRESGDYVIEVVADGDWELEVAHPIPQDAVVHDLPMELSGTGSQAVYFVQAPPGLHTVTLTHDGRRPFTVSVMNSNARAFDRIIDANGEFSGTAAVSVRNEPFDYLIFDIRADGNWTMLVE